MPDAETPLPQDAVEIWLGAFGRALAEPELLPDLFLEDCHWRDVLAATWQMQTVSGRADVCRALAIHGDALNPETLSRAQDGTPPTLVTRAGVDTIEALFDFRTRQGRGRGVVRLCPDPAAGGQLRAWTLLTELDALDGFEEAIDTNRPTGQSHSRDFRGPNWLDQRREAIAYDGRDPTVLVVGGGQAGLAAAARLGALGIDALIVDRYPRIGDNWRTRYHALTLHNQVQVNHLPYMPFPPTWPTYIPKDKLAGWFEAYVEAMELNYWPDTAFAGATRDADGERWTVSLRRQGADQTLRPKHIVMATGVSGIPNIPEIPSLDAFAGTVVHSGKYQDGEDWAGKRALVIGTGNSGHDIAQDLHSSGAEVTIVQRSPTLIVNIEPSAQLPYTLYDEPRSLDECDLITTSMPHALTWRTHQIHTARAKEIDKPLHERLTKVGFRMDDGEEGTGWQFKYLTRGGGYYFNVGCSNLIADGAVRLIQYADIEGFDATGVQLADGSQLPVDLVVLATGYKGQEYLVEKLFGPAVADRIGPIWGFGDGQELRNMYTQTAQPGLWFIAGSLAQCRINSKYLALNIKALEEDLIDR